MTTDHARARRTSPAVLFQGVVLLSVGIVVAYLGSARGASQLNIDEIIGPVLFWYAVLLLLFSFPLRRAVGVTIRALRTRLGVSVFWPYLALHLFIYGFLLEAILAGIYGITLTIGPSFSIVTDAFVPPNVLNALLDLSYSPSAVFTLPPALSGAFSLYSVSAAVVIDVLVVANVTEVVRLGEERTRRQRATSFVALPAVGVILGASCCLSLPALIALTYPSAAVSQSFQTVYSATYFLFPAFAGAILYVNLRSVDAISRRLATERGDADAVIQGQSFRNSC